MQWTLSLLSESLQAEGEKKTLENEWFLVVLFCFPKNLFIGGTQLLHFFAQETWGAVYHTSAMELGLK